ncbi:MAG: quinolinate synthase NadA, partial [Candidatus Pacebacteria bacterium]|nr:quinolinate synthase NadA [Candidatus Paceibacterota bacterium]
NALKVVESLKDYKQIIFIPDKYLGHFLSLSSDKEFIFANGYCPTHAKISPKLIDELKIKYKNAEVLVHGECTPEVKEKADKILSTGKMCSYVKNSSKKDFIIGTEIEMLYRLKRENPEKNLIQASPLAICPDMKRNNSEKILDVLENMKNEVRVDEKIRLRARKCIDRMLLVK